MDPLAEFWQKLDAEWLPTFCTARGYPLTAFIRSKSVSSVDAADFLRAMRFMTPNARGEFVMPRSRAKEVIFWDGSFKSTERKFSLWIEPIVTIAGIARLHLDHGWPLDCLGMQSLL
jgi:hypothetical protein